MPLRHQLVTNVATENTATSLALPIAPRVALATISAEKGLPLQVIAPSARWAHLEAKKEFNNVRHVEERETQLKTVPKKATAFVRTATTPTRHFTASLARGGLSLMHPTQASVLNVQQASIKTKWRLTTKATVWTVKLDSFRLRPEPKYALGALPENFRPRGR
tara:strand:- start:32 stop:520 length:489 start_codon:yes stop_codon:yes gene_type:complete